MPPSQLHIISVHFKKDEMVTKVALAVLALVVLFATCGFSEQSSEGKRPEHADGGGDADASSPAAAVEYKPSPPASSSSALPDRSMALSVSDVTSCSVADGITRCRVTIDFRRRCRPQSLRNASLTMCVNDAIDSQVVAAVCLSIPACEARVTMTTTFSGPIRAWLQNPTSSSSNSDSSTEKRRKIAGSEVYVMLDSRVSESAGFDVVYAGLYFTLNARQTPLSLNLTASLSYSRSSQTSFLKPFSASTSSFSSAYFFSPSASPAFPSEPMFAPLELDFLSPGVAASSRDIVQQAIAQRMRGLHPDLDFTFILAASRAIFDYVWSNAYSFPAVQTMPSVQEPLVFFHIDKCAGTTVRHLLDKTASKHGLVSFIPCYHNISCATFAIPRVCQDQNPLPLPSAVLLSHWGDSTVWDDFSYPSGCPVDFNSASVIAGHFAWDEAWDAIRLRSDRAFRRSKNVAVAQRPYLSPQRSTCLVVGRHPVARIISYYYQRCFDVSSCAFFERNINDIDLEEFQVWLHRYRNGFYETGSGMYLLIDEGLADAACRQILGRRELTGVVTTSEGLSSHPSPVPAHMYEEATSNVDRCVLGLQEDWARTETVVNHWLPWLDFDTTVRESQHSYAAGIRPSDLRPDLRAAIEDANRCDMHLYEHMQERFDAMWKQVVGYTL